MSKILLLIALLVGASYSQSVQSVVNAKGCSTGPVKGISMQLTTEINKLYPGTIVNLQGSGAKISAPLPFIQKSAYEAIKVAVKKRSVSLDITSAYRSVVQQLVLYKWYQMGACGIQIAAKPGTSNHESGLAVDINDYAGWQSSMESSGFKWYGPGDRVHFDYVKGGTNLSAAGVKAFQKLWNCNNPGDKIGEDGLFGTNTEQRILKSPANGFPKGC